jgi:hypothetical protein
MRGRNSHLSRFSGRSLTGLKEEDYSLAKQADLKLERLYLDRTTDMGLVGVVHIEVGTSKTRI